MKGFNLNNLKSKKVDVFLPTYNRAGFLEEMITSILQQTFTNFNLIILDNGSTDNTTEVVDRFKDSRLYYLKNEVNSREFLNLPFKSAESEYFVIVHDDDTLEPNFLENQVPILESNNEINMIASKINLINENGEKLNKVRPRILTSRKLWGRNEFIQDYFLKGDIIPCPTIIFRNSFVKKSKLNFEFKVGPAVDLYFLFRSNLLDGKIGIENKALYNYRIHKNQDSQMNRLNLEYLVRPHIIELLNGSKPLQKKYKKASLSIILQILIHDYINRLISYSDFKKQFKKISSLGLNFNFYSIYWGLFGFIRGVKNRIYY